MADISCFIVVFFVIFSVNVWADDVVGSGEAGGNSHASTDTLLKITSLHIRSDITFRFATTLVTSTVQNDWGTSTEVTFEVRLPKTAFISNFTMLIDGRLYSGDVKEKEAAKKQYETAKKKGQTAGHVQKAKPRETERFRVTVNVAANSEVIFNLTYQELLQRKLGAYEHLIYIDPGQPVPDMRVDVYISESREIIGLIVPPLRNDLLSDIDLTIANPYAVIDQLSPTTAHVAFYPTLAQQVEGSLQGISGQFVVHYDIARQLDAGEIMVVNGYFVHFFAPKGLKPLPKRIMFILDTSTSMEGEKIRQLKEAFITILDDLREEDEFNIIDFNSGISFWNKKKMVAASPENVENAKAFVLSRRATGWTNIYDALQDGLNFLAQRHDPGVNKASIVMFLTDGQPSTGITDSGQITRDTKRSNEGGIALFSIAFGKGADYKLVQTLSAQNFGVARKIYEDSDATLQMKGFYDEISTPVLSNMTVKYLGEEIDKESVTISTFQNYFEGTEVVVAGKIALSNVPTLDLSINGAQLEGDFIIDQTVDILPTPANPEDIIAFTEKLWAYLTIRQLLDQTLAETDESKIRELKQKALDLSIKYQFVTPLTSMVVTKPEADELADDSDDDETRRTSSRTPARQPSQSYSRSSSRRRGGGGGGGGGGSSGDSDPHFIVHVRGIERALCFDVKGKGGDIYQLVADPTRDVYINGQVFGTHVKVGSEKKFRTYFDHIVIVHRSRKLTIKPNKIRMGKQSYRWRKNGEKINEPGFTLTVNTNRNLTVELENNITISVVRHRFRKKQIKFLGIYITNGEGFSTDVTGIMGEFEHKNVSAAKMPPLDGVPRARLTVHRKSGPMELDVRLGERRNLAEDYDVPCWKVRRGGKGLLDYKAPDDYLLKKLHQTTILRRN